MSIKYIAPLPVNEEWFKEQFALRGVSQRALARHLDLDPSAVTHTLQGKRRMQLDEALAIARFLGAPVEDVLRNAGMPLGAAAKIPLVGYMDDTFEVHIEESNRTVEIPARVPPGAVAIVMKGGVTRNGLLVFKPTDSVDPGAVGRMAVVRVKNGPAFACLLEPGFEPGRFNIETRDSQLTDAELQSAAPVLWIRP